MSLSAKKLQENKKKKALAIASAFFCLKRDKRCLNKGKNEQKVSAFAQRVCSDKQQFVYS